MKTTVIMNEQHSLLPSQEDLLKSHFETFDFLKVPDGGLDSTRNAGNGDIFGGEKCCVRLPCPGTACDCFRTGGSIQNWEHGGKRRGDWIRRPRNTRFRYAQ